MNKRHETIMRMEEWKNGRMEEWKNGRMEECINNPVQMFEYSKSIRMAPNVGQPQCPKGSDIRLRKRISKTTCSFHILGKHR